MIEFQEVTIVRGTFRIEGFSLAIEKGRYAVLMGPSGSGKTTLIDALCGLVPLASGRILIDGQDATSLAPRDRGIGYVPQEGSLFPTLDVEANLGFALSLRKVQKPELRTRVRDVAESLGIAHLLERGVAGLSGGERQRVALGRALVFRPRILCLDEPLSSLDEELHGEMLELLKRVHREQELTALHVTHSRREADSLATQRIALEALRTPSGAQRKENITP